MEKPNLISEITHSNIPAMTKSELPFEEALAIPSTPKLILFKRYDGVQVPALEWRGRTEDPAETEKVIVSLVEHPIDFFYPHSQQLLSRLDKFTVAFVGPLRDWPAPEAVDEIIEANPGLNRDTTVTWVLALDYCSLQQPNGLSGAFPLPIPISQRGIMRIETYTREKPIIRSGVIGLLGGDDESRRPFP